MEELLEKILDELVKLNQQVAVTHQAGQAKMSEADSLMKSLLSNLPAGIIKEVR